MPTVVYGQPKDERGHIVYREWLDPYAYPAVYVILAQSVSGTYSVHSYISEGDQWRFMGIFNRAATTQESDPTSP